MPCRVLLLDGVAWRGFQSNITSCNISYFVIFIHQSHTQDDVDEKGQTALHAAVRVSNATAVKNIMENGEI